MRAMHERKSIEKPDRVNVLFLCGAIPGHFENLFWMWMEKKIYSLAFLVHRANWRLRALDSRVFLPEMKKERVRLTMRL
jgi:hypothetical protein